MLGVEVKIPGGLLTNEGIQNKVRFHALTGRIEQALIELDEELERPDFVTAVLETVIDEIGKQSIDSKSISNLCVADRQYLMIRLAAILNGEQMWLTVQCGHCDSIFDMQVHRCDLPVKQAGKDFPYVSLHLNGRSLRLRVPTGRDQQKLLCLHDDKAIEQLLDDCIVSVDDMPLPEDFIANLTSKDVNEIDDSLDEVSPAVCNQLLVSCPECRQEQKAILDHYSLGNTNKVHFYEEVHTLASRYHWSEDAILDLPKNRRHLYIDMINRDNSKFDNG